MKAIKKLLAALLCVLLLATLFAGCSNKAKNFEAKNSIGVISREQGSGTRGAFVKLFSIEQKNEKGQIYDNTTLSAVVTDKTSVMMTTVAGDLYSIGYISLGSLNNTVKAVEIDGVEATKENIKNKTYKVSRPFNIVTAQSVNAQTRDFIDFIMSKDGQAVVEESGYVSVSDAQNYKGAFLSGKIVVSGSSSVTPVMEKLKEAYLLKNPDMTIEVQQSDSSTGIANALDNTCDIGIASRDLKDSEVKKGAVATVIAMDGIVVIVNRKNTIHSLTSEQVRQIFTGEVTVWDEVIK